MRVAIIVIACGKYFDFYPVLRESIHLNFLPKNEKRIFLLTDRIPTHYVGLDNVVYTPFLPKPLNSLLRFHHITSLCLAEYDLVYYLDSDTLVASEINEEIIPEKGKIAAVEHPWQHHNSDSYETNPLSTACVTDSKGMHYFQCSFFGGHNEDVLLMAHELKQNIDTDLANNFIAKWWDESHFNKYMIEHPPKQLNLGYAYPDPTRWNQKFPEDPKIYHFNAASIK